MNKENLLNQINFLGKICNVISVIITMFCCLPLPILIFIFSKKSNRYFSIYNDLKDYANAIISRSVLNQKMRNIKLRLLIFGAIYIGVSIILIFNNNSNESEIIGNYIFASFIFLFIACYYLCIKVEQYLNINKL